MVRTRIATAVIFLTGTFLTLELQGRDQHWFVTADQCMACHNGLTTPSGEEVSIGFNWRASMMANAARDPYWHASVRREVLDHPQAAPAIEDKCATCHMPMARFETKSDGRQEEVFSYLPLNQADGYADKLAADGTSCTLCHQIQAEGLGNETSFTGGFQVDSTTAMGSRRIFGPHEIDPGRQRIMQSASEFLPSQASHLESAEFCASCHTLYTHALGPDGEVLGELPEQVPYLEWAHSSYAGSQSCQSCHMPVVEDEMPISSVLGESRPGFSRHAFRGGNFVMPRVFNRHRDELGVATLPQELESTARQTVEHLATDAARISISSVKITGDRIEASLSVENLAGHKLPTAYPSRRVWIRFVVLDENKTPIFESGTFEMDGSIKGNDNDSDASLYELHYEKIASPDQVQIYESIMVDQDGDVTTGLLSGLRYIKDNRLLPCGFDKTKAHEDIAVHGKAYSDSGFEANGDRIDYFVTLGQAEGPFTVEVELWYQPIAYRWAENLRQYDSSETRRFVSFYDSIRGHSATVMARDTAVVSRAQ